VRLRLQRKGYGLAVTPAAKRWLIDKGYDEKYGVRPLRRVIQDEVEHLIAEGLLDSVWPSGTILVLKQDHAMLHIEIDDDSKPATQHTKTATNAAK
jgi:ATP-dependent Clp protease ATP-binding subunit ClpC